jgi:photosystem II stability/assembly factor-like uncharacterized protein
MNYLRTTLIVIFSFTVSTLLAQAPWTRITPTPQENTINDITRIPGTDRLVAVCEGSTVMMSDDAGETWDLILNPAGRNNQYICKGIHFISETTGFINGGRETILKTTDGGQNWNLEYAGNSIYDWQCINDLEFCTDTHGFAVGDHGQLLETFDAGESWQVIESGVLTNLNHVVFADSLTGFIFTWSTECLKTSNGGATWTLEPLSPEIADGQLYDCYFVNDSTGFVFIYTGSPYADGCIFRTTDAGNNWSLVHTESSAYSGKFAFFDEQHGIMASATWGYQTKFLETENGGITWNVIEEAWLPWWSTYGMICIDQNNVLSVGLYGMIYMSNDGGLSWQPKQSRLFSGDIFDVRFIDEDTGFALTDTGSGGVASTSIKKTLDGGESWEIIYMNSWSYGLDFDFLNNNTGFLAVTGNDTLLLLKTSDGGENWEETKTSFELLPTDIKFFDENNGLISGEYSVVKTSDGGLTWQDVTPGSGLFTFNEIEYRSETEVYIVGSSGYGITIVHRSIDGGDTWQTIFEGDYGPATNIALPDENTILITSSFKIFKSLDNGLTWYWSTSTNPNQIEYRSLHFSSPMIGYAVGLGDFANIEKTTDGGDTWFPLETKITSGLNAACFFNDEEGLGFGDKGVMIRTTTGGVTGTHNRVISEADSYFTASPNPFSDEIIIRPVVGNKVVYPVQVLLTDASGRQIMEKRIESEGTSLRLSGTGLKPGIYICRISSRNGVTETLKLVKIK